MKQLTYQDALAFIHGRTKFKKIPTLDRMRDFCKRLGDPQQNLKMIHVTGTNGKGSTTAYIRQLLMRTDLRLVRLPHHSLSSSMTAFALTVK